MKSINSCNNCELRMNQKPLLDNNKKCQVMWVGLSAKKVESLEVETPLDSNTNSGELIHSIEVMLPKVDFYKTNLVKCLPLNDECKLRYPTVKEKKACSPNLLKEFEALKPQVIFLLGKQVIEHVFKTLEYKGKVSLPKDYNYEKISIGDVLMVPIHHPSYIKIYKSKDIEKYKKAINDIIVDILNK